MSRLFKLQDTENRVTFERRVRNICSCISHHGCDLDHNHLFMASPMSLHDVFVSGFISSKRCSSSQRCRSFEAFVMQDLVDAGLSHGKAFTGEISDGSTQPCRHCHKETQRSKARVVVFFPTCQVRVVRFYVSCLLLLSSSPPLLLSSPPLLSSSSSCSTAIHAQCALPDLNHDHPRSVCPAGPQPRPSPPSVPCRTSTASIPAQCSLPDLNHDHPRPVFPAGPQPRVSTPSVPCRTSCRKICQIECQKVCQIECQIKCQIIECQKICQIKCQNVCQIEGQKICQIICQKICQIECQIECQKICQIECQIECQKICQIECQKVCQIECQIKCQIECQKICQ